MHVKPWAVDPAMDLVRLEEVATRELASIQLPAAYLSAEQLAVGAIKSFESGNLADAALWLSIADHRYGQQATSIARTGFSDRSPLAVLNQRAYLALIGAELDVYGNLGFRDLLRSVGGLLRGEQIVDRSLRERLDEAFREGPPDEESYAEIIRAHNSARGTSVTETVSSSRLAEVYLQHLRATLNQRGSFVVFTERSLALTPLTEFANEGLRSYKGELNLRRCADIADQLSVHRQELPARLSDPDPRTRLNVAIVLGMNPHDDQLPALQSRWNEEKIVAVRLALAYALARHGQRERVADLTQALTSCPGEACTETVRLLNWLPTDLTQDLSPQLFQTLAQDFRQTLDVRLFALATLGGFADRVGLAESARVALFPLAGEKNLPLASAAIATLSMDRNWSPGAAARALQQERLPRLLPLARLARAATRDELPALAWVMGQVGAQDSAETRFILEASSRIAGPDMEDQLVAWFETYPRMRRSIAYGLLRRATLKPSTFVKLEAATEPDVQLLVKVMTRAPDAIHVLEEQLTQGPFPARLFAASVARVVRSPLTKGALTSLLNFRDNRVYPRDGLLRHAASEALLWIAFDETARKKAASPPPVLTVKPAPSRRTAGNGPAPAPL